MKHTLELTPRLQAVADFVLPGAHFADIGTDHAYLPVWLLRQERIDRAIASDLREGPLSRARETARAHGVFGQMDFRLCNGLEGLSAGEANTISIAGMGGETIAAILAACPWAKTPACTFLLQPMSTQPVLRSWLWRSGFFMEQERLVQEGEKLYTVILARYGGAVPLTPAQEWAGRQWPGMEQPLRTQYLDRLLHQVSRVVQGLGRGRSDVHVQRLDEMEQLYTQLNEMRQEWLTWCG